MAATEQCYRCHRDDNNLSVVQVLSFWPFAPNEKTVQISRTLCPACKVRLVQAVEAVVETEDRDGGPHQDPSSLDLRD